METRPIIETDAERGFSLLETLFALAIMSLASVALFQSTSSMLTLSDRAVKAGERTVNSGLDRLALTGVIEGLLPHWPKDKDSAFAGEARELRGVSAGSLTAGATSPEPVMLMLQAQASGTDALLYRSPQAPEGWELISRLPSGARFEYMGVDQNWYALWPPETIPARGYFDEAQMMSMPALPQAVRLRSQDAVLWTARISQSAILPPRLDLEAGL